MVGFKSVWLLILSLLLLGACVPQNKQTECGSNEAFNSQLRTCIPIVQQPSSFISIKTYSPLYPSSVYVSSSTSVTLRILEIEDPYGQGYTLEWEHSYNGSEPDGIAGDVDTITVFPAVDYSGQIGAHYYIAKVLDTNGVTVDSHQFEVIISDTPKPSLVTFTPSDTYIETDPSVTSLDFSVREKNNNATSISDYVVRWRLSKNGVSLTAYNETDTLTNTSTNGENLIYYGTSSASLFDPSILGIGSYVLRAILVNGTTEEVVTERQWSIEVEYPDFGFISSASAPITGQDTIAFFNTDYSTFGFANSSNVQSQFCVTLSDPDGSYTNGSAQDLTDLDMVVRFYKDGVGSPIFEGTTDGSSGPIKDTVCFDEADPSEQAQLFYGDGSPTVSHYRTLTARVFDEQTGREICSTGMPTCTLAYPVSWNILVKPVNQGATAAFATSVAGDNITYTSSGASTRTAEVDQDATVNVRFTVSDGVAGLEGYDMTGLDVGSNFKFTVRLKKDGVTIEDTVCKDFADPFPRVGATSVMMCTFTAPSYDPITGDHLDPGSYVATLLIEDTDSPVPGSVGVESTALTMNLTVNEVMNAPTFIADFLDSTDAIVVPPIDEGDLIKFRVQVTDDEHNDYTLQVEHCGTDNGCDVANRTLINTDSRSWGDAMYSTNTAITYTLKEDELGAAANGDIYFRIVVRDAPVTTALSDETVQIVSLNLNNFNEVPLIDMTAASPAVNNATAYDVFTGYTFSANVTTAITDPSNVVSEQITDYQWWIGTVDDPSSSVGWSAIVGETSHTLRWTPGPELSGTRYITVCYSDGSPRTTADSTNPPGTAGLLCSADTWAIEPRSNLLTLTTPAAPNGQVAVTPVTAENLIYMAYADDDVIYVEKVAYDTDGQLTRPMRVASFNALSAGTAQTVKNLSIATSDTSLYVSYLADSATAPESFRARIRRININDDVTEGGTKSDPTFAAAPRKFDFTYSTFSVATSCTSGTNCVWTPATRTMTFDGTANLVGDTITVTVTPYNPVVLSFSVDPYTTGTVCANCSATVQAESFAEAINFSLNTDIQGLTGYYAGAPSTDVVLFGVENDAEAIYDSTQSMTAMGKILVNPNDNRWYLPVANADLLGSQNKIQILNGDDADLSSPDTTTIVSTLNAVGHIDNAWTGDATVDMFLGYIELSGSLAKVAKVSAASSFATVTAGPLTIAHPDATSTSFTDLQLAGPIGTVANPSAFLTLKDAAGVYYVSRVTSTLASQSTHKVSEISDPSDTSILDDDEISAINIQPAQPLSPATTTDEGRVVVISKSGGVDYKSYLFRWKLDGATQVLDTSTEFDNSAEEVDASSKLATFAPTSLVFGNGGSVVSGNTNSTMGVLRLRADGEVEAALLNTEVESINSTTNSATGEYRAPFVK